MSRVGGVPGGCPGGEDPRPLEALPLPCRVSALAERLRSLNPALRWGQALFNALAELDPHLANRLRGGRLDPFHNDLMADRFLFAVRELSSEVPASVRSSVGGCTGGKEPTA